MIKIEFPVEIERPVDEVFNYVTDPAKLGEWQRTIVSVTQQTDGPMDKGTRLLEVRSAPFGKRAEALVEVSEFEQNRKFGLRIVSGPLPIDGHHTFSSVDGGNPHRFRCGRPPQRTDADCAAATEARARPAVQALLRRVEERAGRLPRERCMPMCQRHASLGSPP